MGAKRAGVIPAGLSAVRSLSLATSSSPSIAAFARRNGRIPWVSPTAAHREVECRVDRERIARLMRLAQVRDVSRRCGHMGRRGGIRYIARPRIRSIGGFVPMDQVSSGTPT